MTAAARLDRRIFSTSRLAEFTSEKELTAQTGHTSNLWPLVILKELVDNALDEAERAGIQPEVEITLDIGNGKITVIDNGGGIAEDTVRHILDFTTRTSDKEAYVSPTRGAQGNALKTVLAMPFALDGTTGRTVIESRGVRHDIVFSIDPIRREPKIEHTTEPFFVKNGTRVVVHLDLLVRRCRSLGPFFTNRRGFLRAKPSPIAEIRGFPAAGQQPEMDEVDAGRSYPGTLVFCRPL
jgi:DNA topoisomerase VI subunit B